MPASKLLQRQWQMTRMLPELINFIHSQGYECTLGDAFRDPRVFGKIGERKGYGESKSAHKQKLAIDLNLFKPDGTYLSKTESHKVIGAFWKSKGGSWGGDFQDGNHYSLEFNGIK